MATPLSPATGLRPPAAALALVPGLEQGAMPERLERLDGGSVNDSWRVDTADGRFVLRLDGAQWRRPGVERGRERALQALAATAGLAPRVVRAAPEAGVLISEFAEGRCWNAMDLQSRPQLARLGERLALLHSLPAPGGKWRFEPQALAVEYLRLAANPAASAVAAATLWPALDAAVARVGEAGVAPVLIHGDLVHGNLLDGTRLWLLDWEYAQLADPCFDLACVLAYYPAARPQAAWLLAAAGLAGPADAERLAAATYVYQVLTWAWHLARGEYCAMPAAWR